MVDMIARVADSLAAGIAAQEAPSDRFFGTVRSVNSDGTLSVESGTGRRTSVRALQSYTPRAVGDVVLVVLTSIGPIVEGVLGGPSDVGPTGLTVSDSSAPGGAGWYEIVTGQLWAKAGALWAKRLVSLPPPTGGSVTQAATTLTTYRGGSLSANGVAEQGDYTGRGLQTGLATFGSWAGLSGHTATGGTLTIHRRASGHGFTYGTVTAYGWRCVASGQPTSPPTLTPVGMAIGAALNETQSVSLPAWWAQDYCTGAATAVAFYSDNANDNIEIDAVVLSVSY